MSNTHYPRKTGRTTWMLVRALASSHARIKIVSPTQAMAKYNMDLFVDLIERITKGTADFKVSRSKMTIELNGKTFFFEGCDNPSDERGCETKEVHKDHTCYEEGFKK